MHIYDYIIIGSGLTGLTIAQKLSQETENILVLDAQDFAGGDNRPAQLNHQTINNGLRFFPATDQAMKSLEFLEELLKTPLVSEVIENNPETYEASGFKKFVGFGDKSVDFYDQLSYFLANKEVVLASTPYEWIQKFQESLSSKIQTKSIVTRFGFEQLESENPQLTHVIVNGTKQFHARNFIFTGPVKDLGLLLSDEILNQRVKAKLKKSQAWQAICLDLFHKEKVSQENIFVLNGTTDDELGPCVGRFLKTDATSEGQISQWVSFIDVEAAEDTENIGHVLKKMKRQIKRAFPEASDSVSKERIFVTPPLSGADLKLTASGTIPKVPNLWIASPHLSKSKNLLASLQQSQLVLASMGFHSGFEIAQENTQEEVEVSIEAEI
jgi:hypothetical protein